MIFNITVKKYPPYQPPPPDPPPEYEPLKPYNPAVLYELYRPENWMYMPNYDNIEENECFIYIRIPYMSIETVPIEFYTVSGNHNLYIDVGYFRNNQYVSLEQDHIFGNNMRRFIDLDYNSGFPKVENGNYAECVVRIKGDRIGTLTINNSSYYCNILEIVLNMPEVSQLGITDCCNLRFLKIYQSSNIAAFSCNRNVNLISIIGLESVYNMRNINMSGCYNLEGFPDTFNFEENDNISTFSMSNCYNIRTSPNIKKSLYNISNIYNKCYNLFEPPVLIAQSSLNSSNAFNSCVNMKYLRTDYTFNNSTNIIGIFDYCHKIIEVHPLNTINITTNINPGLFYMSESLIIIKDIDFGLSNITNPNVLSVWIIGNNRYSLISNITLSPSYIPNGNILIYVYISGDKNNIINLLNSLPSVTQSYRNVLYLGGHSGKPASSAWNQLSDEDKKIALNKNWRFTY